MRSLSFKCRSSTPGKWYRVDFIFRNSGVAILCNCQAGTMGIFCKHKRALITVDKSMLDDAGETGELDGLDAFLSETGVRAVYEQYATDLQAIEGLLQSDKSNRVLIDKRDRLKRDFARKVREGI